MGISKSAPALATLLLLAVSTWGSRASALHLYLDMNNNPEEQAAFRQSVAALRVPERIVFIPEANVLNAIQLKSLTNARDKVWEQYAKRAASLK